MTLHLYKKLDLSNVHYDEEGYIKPNSGCIDKLIACLRPYHKIKPQIFAELKNNKIISHNYGHGGNGYCYLFGAVEKSIENFQKVRYEQFYIDRNDEITVIGLGCMGLVTALNLYFKGYKNIKLVGENFEGICSKNSGALFEMSLLTSQDDEELVNLMNECFKASFYEYKSIIEGKHKYIKYGVRPITLYANFIGDKVGLSHLAKLGLVKPKEDVMMFFGKDKEIKKPIFKVDTFHVIPGLFMDSLLYTIKKLNIPIEFKKITTFSEIKSKTIFNCTGLGARELNDDANMEPVCGHVVTLKNVNIKDCDIIFRLKTVPGYEKYMEEYESIYYLPNSSGYIGGTYMKGYDGSDDKLNKEKYKKLVQCAQYLFNATLPMKPKF